MTTLKLLPAWVFGDTFIVAVEDVAIKLYHTSFDVELVPTPQVIGAILSVASERVPTVCKQDGDTVNSIEELQLSLLGTCANNKELNNMIFSKK
jgi:hypothetical protein